MNYLINVTETYRVPTIADVEKLHSDLKNDIHFWPIIQNLAILIVHYFDK